MLVNAVTRSFHERDTTVTRQALINAHKAALEKKRKSIVKQKKSLDARVAARQERDGAVPTSSAAHLAKGEVAGGGGLAAMMARQKEDRFGLMPREAAKVSAGYGDCYLGPTPSDHVLSPTLTPSCPTTASAHRTPHTAHRTPHTAHRPSHRLPPTTAPPRRPTSHQPPRHEQDALDRYTDPRTYPYT